MVLTLASALSWLAAAEKDPFADLDAARAETARGPAALTDPFAELDAAMPEARPGGGLRADVETPFRRGGFDEGFSFKREIMSEFSRSSTAAGEPGATADGWYSRQSIGLEALKKFSTDTATVASFDLQLRLVRRDNYHEVLNDAEGADREGWFLEYHNLYLDLYNFLNPVLGDRARGRHAGRFNLRLGRFYLPFGLNLQTDTHGTLIQLSNERNFGFERDWYAGFWGSVNGDLNYDLYYLLGSGYDIAFEGQKGMIGARLSLAAKYLNEHGLEGGLSLLSGQRLSEHALHRSPSVALLSTDDGIIDTLRYGADVRWRHRVPTGSVALTAEVSAGRDERDDVFTQLYQADYLTRNRRFGASAQYRRFNQDLEGRRNDASIIGEISWYFRNDLGNANLHWIKLNVERETEAQDGRNDTIVTLQYYRYW